MLAAVGALAALLAPSVPLDPDPRLGTGVGRVVVAARQAAAPVVAGKAVDPAECTVAPRPLDDFRRLPECFPSEPESPFYGTPVATPAPPTGGTPADPATVAAIEAVVRERVACVNAGDFARAAALDTDDAFLRSWTGPGADTPDERLATLLRPGPLPPDQRARLVAVEHVLVSSCGRVTAELRVVVPGRSGESRSLVAFRLVDGRWLIDGTYPLPDAATPAP